MNSVSVLKQLIANIHQGDYSTEYARVIDDSVTSNKRFEKFYQKIVSTRAILFSQQCLEIADRHQKDGAVRKALTWYMRVLVSKTQLNLAYNYYHNYGVCLTKLEMYDRAMQMFFEALLIKPKAKETRHCFAWALYLAHQYSGSLHLFQTIKDEDNFQSCHTSIFCRLAEIECCIHVLRMTDAKKLLSKFINEITTFTIDSSVQRYSVEISKRYADQLNAHYNFPVLSADQDGSVDDKGERNGGMQKSTMQEVNLSPLPRLKRGRQVLQRDNKQHQLSLDMGKSSVSNFRPSPRRTPPHDQGDPLRNKGPNNEHEHHNRCSSYGNIKPQRNFSFEVTSQIPTVDSKSTELLFPLCEQSKSERISDRSTSPSGKENRYLQPIKLPDKEDPISTPSSTVNLEHLPQLQGHNIPHAVKLLEDNSSSSSNGYIPISQVGNKATESTKSPGSKTDSRKKHNRTRKIASKNDNLDLPKSAKVTESSEETQSDCKFQRISKKTIPPNSKENFLSTKVTRVSTEKDLYLDNNCTHSTLHSASDNGMFVLNVVDFPTPPPCEMKVENPTYLNMKEPKLLHARESNVTSHQKKSLQVKMNLEDTSSASMTVVNPYNESEMGNKTHTTTEKVAFLRVTDHLLGAVPLTAPPEDVTPDFSDDFLDGESTTNIEFHASQDLSPTLTSVDVFYKHEQLIAPGPYPAGICIRKREIYLAEEEFKKILGVSRSTWDSLPRWKQEQRKRAAKLF